MFTKLFIMERGKKIHTLVFVTLLFVPFWGVASDESIKRITPQTIGTAHWEGVDDITFGPGNVYIATITKTADGSEEGLVNGEFTVNLNQAVLTGTGGLNIGYSVDATPDNSATPNADYTAFSGVVTIADDAISATITVPVIDDGEWEPGDPETVAINLIDAIEYDLGEPASAVVTITDNEVADSNVTLNKDSDVNQYSLVGDVINYTYTITYNGNLRVYFPPDGEAGYLLSGEPWKTVTDDQEEVSCPTESGQITLNPGETIVCTASHTVVQADLDNESLKNVATAFAYNFFESPNPESPNLEESNPDELTVTILIDFDVISSYIEVRTVPFGGDVISESTTGTEVFVHGVFEVTTDGTINTDVGTLFVDGAVLCNIPGFGGPVAQGSYWNYCPYTPTTPGVKVLHWQVDPGNEIPESNEVNNSVSLPWTVTGDPVPNIFNDGFEENP